MAVAARNPETFTRNEKLQDTRHQNIVAARALADAVRTSLGPRGLDKMITSSKGETLITNDGATIMAQFHITHPCARMLVELSRAQDLAVGDGTTSVVVIAGSLLAAAARLLERGVHAQAIASSFLKAAQQAAVILRQMSRPIDLSDKAALEEAAITALSSKIVAADASTLAPLAVQAVLRVLPAEAVAAGNDKESSQKTLTDSFLQAGFGEHEGTVDLKNDVRVVKKLGDTVDSTELVEGLIFTEQKVSKVAGGPSRIANAKIGLIQFCLSPPKTDMENNIVVKDYAAMDRLLREERLLTAKSVKAIAATGCNVLFIQKSILRDAVSDLALDYLAKKGILVVRDIERDDIDFITRTLNCDPVASLDHFTAEKLGHADLVTDETTSAGRIVRVTGVPGRSTVTVLCRSSNALMLDEVERSFHDALCVVRSLVQARALLPGGGAPEIELAVRLAEYARTLDGSDSICVRAFAEALEVIPFTLAENAGLSPVELVTDLRNKHINGNANLGLNVRKGGIIADMYNERVVQPLMNTLSAVRLATETVVVILKIDDIVLTR